MIAFVVFLLFIIGLLIAFTENTKTGRKIMAKIFSKLF